MTHTLAKRFAIALLIWGIVVASRTVHGQTNANFTAAGPANWNQGGNWSTFQVPEAAFNENAVISGNQSAFVDTTVPDIGGINLSASTLDIRSGGSLAAVSNSLVTGGLSVGATGNLMVKRGGSLSAVNLTTAGNTSQITLGETGGAGTATFTVSNATLQGTTRVVGPNVSFSASGGLAFSGTSTYSPVITGTSHSTINVTGQATLGGKVRPEFSGYTPVLGNSWNLVSAGEIGGNFAPLDTSLLPSTPRGTGFALSTSATSATLRFTNKLVLSVDRVTGATKIENVVGSPIQFDGYSMSSAGGRLSGSWNSLDDQNVSGWDEADNSNSFRRTEFNSTASTSINAGGSHVLGNPYSPPMPTAIGQVVEDISFQYAVPGQGTVDGIVEHTGRRNNLVLTINPTTGAAAIQNESAFFDVAIDAYTITSASGRLLVANGTWNSLDDQNLGNWDQADNSNANRITEFNTQGTTAMAGNGTVLNLGTPISTAGGPLELADFTFEYAISSSSDGDYNSDGIVDTADYTVWRDHLGSPTALPNDNTPGVGTDDYTRWKANFGNTGGSQTIQGIVAFGTLPGSGAGSAGLGSLGTVPEPSSLSGLLLLSSILAVSRAFPSSIGRCERT